jgi:TRAP-type C4-dicarboxylate transport system substrate-binding protein
VLRYAALCAALSTSGVCYAQQAQLKLGFPPPPSSYINTKSLAPWAKEVEQATGGAVAIQIFVGGQLATYNNALDRVLNNVADIVYGMHGPLGNQYPKTSVTQIPFVENASSAEISVALWRLYETGVIADEYANVKPLALSVFMPSGFLGPKPIKSLDDFKGFKVAVGSRQLAQIADIAGAAAVTMAAPDVYQSLQRGLVDAAALGWAAVVAYKLNEVSKFYLDAPLGNSSKFVFMNKDAYAKLPDASRQALDKLSGVSLSRRQAEATAEEGVKGREMVAALPGHTISVMSDAEIARWKPRFAAMVDDWVKATPDGARVLAAYRTEVQKARAETR